MECLIQFGFCRRFCKYSEAEPDVPNNPSVTTVSVARLIVEGNKAYPAIFLTFLCASTEDRKIEAISAIYFTLVNEASSSETGRSRAER